MANVECYHAGGFDPTAPTGNLAERWSNGSRSDDPPAGVVMWNEDGAVVAQRPLTDDEEQRLAALDASNALPELVTVQVDPSAVSAALTAAEKATTVASLRAAVVGLAQQLQP